jgi:hypothetical protein
MHNLAKNLADFDKETARITSIYRIHNDPSTSRQVRMAVLSYSVVRLQNAWCLSCRTSITNYCREDCLTLKNSLVTRSSVCRGDPVEYLRQHWGRKRMEASWEPDWHVPAVSIRAATLLGINNLGSLTTALGAVTVADQVRWARNVICHNLPRIRTQFNAMTLSTQLRSYRCVEDYLVDLYQGTYQSVLEYWITELRIALALALS